MAQATNPFRQCLMCRGTGDRPGYADEACRSCGGRGYKLARGVRPEAIEKIIEILKGEGHEDND